jgi:hypothetical protein
MSKLVTYFRKVLVVAWMEGGATGWIKVRSIAEGNTLWKKLKKKGRARRWMCRVPTAITKIKEVEEYIEDNYHDTMFGKWDRERHKED